MPRDKVEIDNEKLKIREKKYVIFNKPAGYITTKADPQERKTIYSILPQEIHHLKPVGRLDKDSSGLLLLTNDGDLIQKLTHPKLHIPKVYRVTVEGKVSQQKLKLLKDGIEIEKGKIAHADALILDYENGKTILEITLYQGYNRQIRKMMGILGHPVLTLKRIAHDKLSLSGVAKGKYRYLSSKEVKDLKADLLKRFLKSKQ